MFSFVKKINSILALSRENDLLVDELVTGIANIKSQLPKLIAAHEAMLALDRGWIHYDEGDPCLWCRVYEKEEPHKNDCQYALWIVESKHVASPE